MDHLYQRKTLHILIKKRILNKLFELEIYNKNGEKVLEHIRTISLLIYVNILVLVKNIVIYEEIINFITIPIINIIVLILRKLYRNYTKVNGRVYINPTKDFRVTLILIQLLIIGIIFLTYSFKQHYIILIFITVLIILNTITLFKSKLHILTRKGREEYAKVYGLKAYIIDYSLMSKRDVESTIIWDEYLAYAVAFSIPNKITDRFNSSLMEANIILQKIDKFITS